MVFNSMVIVPYACFDFLHNSYTELSFALFFILSSLFVAAFLYKFKMQRFGGLIFASIFSSLWIIFFLHIGSDNLALIFFLIYPQVITILLHYRHALIVNLIMFFTYIILFSFDLKTGSISIMPPLPMRIGSVFLMNLVTVYFWKKNNTDTMEEIHTIALYDSLTGIANKQHFEIYLQNIISYSSKHNKKFSLMFLDIDNFKKINDSPGHEVGNKVLRDVASRINRSLNSSDSLFRVGSDEFIAILPEIDDDFASALMAGKILSVEDSLIHLPTLSIGIVNYPEDGTTRNELVQKSENAMYKAKKNGKNTFSFFHREFDAQIKKRLLIEKHLRVAQLDDEFTVVFQPKIDSTENKIVGAEALIRWKSPILGNIPPSDFISIAEDSDIIHRMSTWVYRKAFNMLALVHKSGHGDFVLSINVSPLQISKNTLISSLNDALKISDVSPEFIELEITEGMLLDSDGNNNEALRYLKQRGFRISVDDFGTGYSSLSYLQNLNLDSIKIDKTFINNIHEKNSRNITKAIISLAVSMELQTIAEGVETSEQMQALRELGCDLIQGFYFSKAVNEDDLMKMLSDVVEVK